MRGSPRRRYSPDVKCLTRSFHAAQYPKVLVIAKRLMCKALLRPQTTIKRRGAFGIPVA